MHLGDNMTRNARIEREMKYLLEEWNIHNPTPNDYSDAWKAAEHTICELEITRKTEARHIVNYWAEQSNRDFYDIP